MQEVKLRKGLWFGEEDESLANAIAVLGERRWDALAKASGLRRSGKSCRLRWMNYLRPNLKHGQITAEEEHVIVELHAKWGNKWSRIARRLPGRTDNEIKNYWRSYMKRKSHNALDEELVEKLHEESHSTISSSGNASLRSECEKSTTNPCSVNGECFSFKSGGVDEFNADSSNAFEMLNLTESPYNTRLTASIQETEEQYWNFHNPEWISYDYSIWDCSLWN